MAASDYILGEYCDDIGISIANLQDVSLLPTLSSDMLTKGVVFELNKYRSNNSHSWNDLYTWLTKLCGCTPPSTLASVKTALSKLNKKRAELIRNKCSDQVNQIFKQPFFPQPKVHLEVSSVAADTATQQDIHITGAKLCTRNVNKKLRRRDERIKQYKEDIKSLCKQNDILQKNLETAKCKKEQSRVAAFRSSKSKEAEVAEIDVKIQLIEENLLYRINELETTCSHLKECIEETKIERDELSERLSQVESKVVATKTHKQLYNDNVRQCCMELMSFNVGMKQVEPVIKSVLHNLTNLEVAELPKLPTLVSMLPEMKTLAYQQLGEELTKSSNLTLHSDGTSKFSQHYEGFQVSTSLGSYSLGLTEILTGSADVALQTLKGILEDINFVVGNGTGQKILACIKNTMSDRHIVEKNFNKILEDYRAEVLPEVVSNWSALSIEEKSNFISLNNIFCGMHVIVGLADTAAAVLLEWEKVCSDSIITSPHAMVNKSEPGTIRLIRTACKAFSKHGSEKSGVYQPFTAFLKLNKIPRNPLASFRGNRFNIVFYDAGALYQIAPVAEKFLKDVWQTPNQLLKAVLADLLIPQYIAGCKALGIISKIVTAPLWRVLECKDVTILDMNERFRTLLTSLKNWSCDPTSVISGDAFAFDDFPPKEDDIYQSLFTKSTHDDTVCEILKLLFAAFYRHLMHLVEDHLPGGRYDGFEDRLSEETISVPKTNTVSERDFAQLDRLLREKPNSAIISLEALILFNNNQTYKWLDHKEPSVRAELMANARKCGLEFKKQYKIRKGKMLEERNEILRAKQTALARLQEKKVRVKEHLTQAMMVYGLWQTKEQISQGIAKCKSNTSKLKALKAQLDFRKKVLEQEYNDRYVFCLSKNKRKLTVDEVCSNLEKLLCSCSNYRDLEGLAGKRIKHKWKDEDDEKWYYGTILNLVPGTKDWYNIKYDGEEEVLSLNILIDIEKGDLEFLD